MSNLTGRKAMEEVKSVPMCFGFFGVVGSPVDVSLIFELMRQPQRCTCTRDKDVANDDDKPVAGFGNPNDFERK